MKRVFIFLSFLYYLFALTQISPLLHSQTMEEKLKEMEKARWKIGPLRVSPVIYIINVGFDSNVYGTPWNPVEDYTFTAGPGFNFYFPIKKRFLFNGSFSPQYVYFYQEKKERTWNHYGSFSLYMNLRRFLIRFGKSYSNARERWNTEIDIRPRRKEDTSFLAVSLQTRRRFLFSFGWRKSDYDYENIFYERFNLRDILNRKDTRFNGIIHYKLFPKTKFFVEYERKIVYFDNPESKRDSNSNTVYCGFDFHPSSIFNGKIKIGYEDFRALKREGQDYKGIVGDTDLTFRIFKFIHLKGFYHRDIEYSMWYNNVYFIETRYGGGFSIYGLRRIRLDYTYSIGNNRYPAILEEFDLRGKRFDKYRAHIGGIFFRVKGDIGVGLIFSRWIRDSNFDWEKDKRFTLGAQLIHNF